MIKWTTENDSNARNKGWVVSHNYGSSFYPEGLPTIQKNDESEIFESDSNALHHVMNEAIKGDCLARKAILYVIQESEPDNF